MSIFKKLTIRQHYLHMKARQEPSTLEFNVLKISNIVKFFLGKSSHQRENLETYLTEICTFL